MEGSAKLFFLCSVETINDGNFHIVELLALDQSLSLSVDGGSPKIITNLSKQSTLNFDSPLYVGGKCFQIQWVSQPCDSHHRLILKLLLSDTMVIDQEWSFIERWTAGIEKKEP